MGLFKTKPGLPNPEPFNHLTMCGRYSFVPTKKQLDEQLREVELPLPLQLRFNIAPTNTAYVITNDQPHVLQPMVWGLIPHWSRDGANAGKLINARAESLLEKPSFRVPAVRRHCLVPADSFYEWKTLSGKRKVPYRIKLKNGQLLFMAGIWDEWRGGGGEIKRSFSIITTTPNTDVASLHDRMPVLFPDVQSRQEWLAIQDPEAIRAMLHPPENDLLELYRVTDRLNKPGVEGPELHERVPDDDPPTLFS